MTTPRVSRSMIRVIFLGALSIASVAAGAELSVIPLAPVVFAQPGGTVVIVAAIQNSTEEVVFLQSISTDANASFVAADAFDDFLASAPDSLLPGESWEGPILKLTLAADAPLDSMREVRVNFSGGDHPYDGQDLAEFTIALNDSAAIVGVEQDVTRSSRPVELRVWPNPMRGATTISLDLATSQEIEVGVYDVRGAAIRSLARGGERSGHLTFVWDGRSDVGEIVAPGLYFIKLRTADGTRHTKVVRIE